MDVVEGNEVHVPVAAATCVKGTSHVPVPGIEVAVDEEKPSPHDSAAEQLFYVKRVFLQGDEDIPFEKFEALLADYSGREITLSEIEQLQRALEAFYRESGFFAMLPGAWPRAGSWTCCTTRSCPSSRS